MVSVLSVQNDIIPPTINHEEDDKDEEIDYNLNFHIQQGTEAHRARRYEQHFRLWRTQCLCYLQEI
mgnify:CR=1 FL=1